MSFNTKPLRDITQEDIDTYKRDGAVVLRNVFDTDWIDSLESVARRSQVDGEDLGLLPHSPGKWLAHAIPEFRRFAFESPVGEAAGKVMQSKEIRFFSDSLFAKPPQSTRPTVWHNDRMGWPVTGKMVPSLWIPLTPIVKENCLEVLAGTHNEDVQYWLFSRNAQRMIKPDDRPIRPEIECHRGDPNYNFLSWDMDRGDMLVVHPWVLHYSGGNPTNDWRIAASLRVFGDDIRWDPRPDANNVAGVSFDEMIEGERPMGTHFPLIWSEDGQRDDCSTYPHGFSTSWPKMAMDPLEGQRRADVMKRLEKEGALSDSASVPKVL
ncbi:phytanoyl-CoA dioxygenase family protein [uncultured Parasphingorhabdus sp.]|uniref:phytanoyl-CoA dioxygenase family protein n=1 Tax=uncultured Parasphingorhabdus sp. TaxID=2709694 RepID=UPI002AA75D00|nr:phytanoyl-CoA dioxygenase family protein [uncultured Parasphingorhabdus sp.]